MIHCIILLSYVFDNYHEKNFFFKDKRKADVKWDDREEGKEN